MFLRKLLLVSTFLFISSIYASGLSGNDNVDQPTDVNTSKLEKIHFGVEAGYGLLDIGAKETARTIEALASSPTTWVSDKGVLLTRVYGEYPVLDKVLLALGLLYSSKVDATYTLQGVTAAEGYHFFGIDLSGSFKHTLAPARDLYAKFGLHLSKLQGAASITIAGNTYEVTAAENGLGYLIGVGMDFERIRCGITYYANVASEEEADVSFLYVGYKF